jgi:hypothetical protein
VLDDNHLVIISWYVQQGGASTKIATVPNLTNGRSGVIRMLPSQTTMSSFFSSSLSPFPLVHYHKANSTTLAMCLSAPGLYLVIS